MPTPLEIQCQKIAEEYQRRHPDDFQTTESSIPCVIAWPFTDVIAEILEIAEEYCNAGLE